MNCKLTIELKSDALIGSGEGFGAIIDTDVVFDDVGLPYIPGRRIKGCLRDSANEVVMMFEKAKIVNFIKNLSKNKKGDGFVFTDEVFGTPESPSCLNISNLTIEEYENSKKSLQRFIKEYSAIMSKDEIISYFTSIRQQTKIDDEKGVAEEHSLRTVRAVKKGNIFEGSISIDNPANDTLKLLWLACVNLRHIGTKRNRGFGEIKCLLYGENNKVINFENELEEASK